LKQILIVLPDKTADLMFPEFDLWRERLGAYWLFLKQKWNMKYFFQDFKYNYSLRYFSELSSQLDSVP